MGKIVKFCASCQESFAEKFSFCPNCASELSPFEMKPVEDTPTAEEFVDEVPTADISKELETTNLEDKKPIIAASDTVEEFEEQAVFEPVNFAEESADEIDASADDILEIEVEEPAAEEKVFVADESSDAANDVEEMATMYSADEPQDGRDADYSKSASVDDDAYHVTVVSEKGGKVRNGLLLSAFAIVIFGFFGLLVYSLFANLNEVASLGDDERLLALLNENPMQTEDKEEKKNDDEGGGGGGGGKNNPKPASAGELPNQTRVLLPPPKVVPRLPNPSLAVINRTQGDIKDRERTDVTGIPGALSRDPSSGRGSGGGIGDGEGTGIGNGIGTGEGNGTGSGSGNGNGNGTGDGDGDGNNGRNRRVVKRDPPPPPPPTPPRGPTKGIRILSKPKPGYTDAARQNNVRGIVRVKVAFLASGRIGSVRVVKGLPHGLTEKALAAARQIRFEPPMRNGVPYSVNKTVVFNFNIY